jgi:hypothetical protein
VIPPPLTAEHELIRDAVATTQDDYRTLSSRIAEASVDDELVRASRAALNEATELLSDVRMRLGALSSSVT